MTRSTIGCSTSYNATPLGRCVPSVRWSGFPRVPCSDGWPYRLARVLLRNVAVLDPRRTADIVLAIVLVTLDRESSAHHEAFQRRLTASPEVQQVYAVSGEWDYVVVLATIGMGRHTAVADRMFKDAPNVKKYTTLFVLDPVRTGSYVPTR